MLPLPCSIPNRNTAHSDLPRFQPAPQLKPSNTAAPLYPALPTPNSEEAIFLTHCRRGCRSLIRLVTSPSPEWSWGQSPIRRSNFRVIQPNSMQDGQGHAESIPTSDRCVTRPRRTRGKRKTDGPRKCCEKVTYSLCPSVFRSRWGSF